MTGANRKYIMGMMTWLVVLFMIALGQNYLRYGHHSTYNVWNSVIYLGVTVLLFIPFAFLAIGQMQKLKHQMASIKKYLIVAGATILFHYVIATVVIHLLGFYDSFFEIKFARQYFGREVFFHALSLAALTYVISQVQRPEKMISGSMGRKELTLQAKQISWIEADDHYLKIYAGDTQLVKRATLEQMATDLSPDFIRIHRKYLVNRQQIVGKEKKQRDEFVVLASGERLKVGRSFSPLTI